MEDDDDSGSSISCDDIGDDQEHQLSTNSENSHIKHPMNKVSGITSADLDMEDYASQAIKGQKIMVRTNSYKKL